MERDVDFNIAARLDPRTYAAHGGAFPLLVEGSGGVSSIAASGLAQRDDHRFVVGQVQLFRAELARNKCGVRQHRDEMTPTGRYRLHFVDYRHRAMRVCGHKVRACRRIRARAEI